MVDIINPYYREKRINPFSYQRYPYWSPFDPPKPKKPSVKAPKPIEVRPPAKPGRVITPQSSWQPEWVWPGQRTHNKRVWPALPAGNNVYPPRRRMNDLVDPIPPSGHRAALPRFAPPEGTRGPWDRRYPRLAPPAFRELTPLRRVPRIFRNDFWGIPNIVPYEHTSPFYPRFQLNPHRDDLYPPIADNDNHRNLPVVDVGKDMMRDVQRFNFLSALRSPWWTVADLLIRELYDWLQSSSPGLEGWPEEFGTWKKCGVQCVGGATHGYPYAGPDCQMIGLGCDERHALSPAPVPVGDPRLDAGFLHILYVKPDGFVWNPVVEYHRPAVVEEPAPRPGGVVFPSPAPYLEPFPEAFPDPLERPERGPEIERVRNRTRVRPAVRIGSVDFVPRMDGDVDVVVNPRPAPEKAPQVVLHPDVPDGAKKGEKLSSRAFAVLLKTYHSGTEVKDFFQSLADAMPHKPCSKLPGVRMAVCVLNNLNKIDARQAAFNLIYNEVEDTTVARVSGQLQKLTNRSDWHGPSGTQFQQFGRTLQQMTNF